jgi:hypothetical protein
MVRWNLPAAGALVLLAAAGVCCFARHHEVRFLRLHDAHDRLKSAGFCCVSDREDGILSTGFLLSRRPLSWIDAGSLCKTTPMGPHWQGKVGVTVNNEHWEILSLPDRAGVRVWGKVVAYGDEDLLNEIDAALGNRFEVL